MRPGVSFHWTVPSGSENSTRTSHKSARLLGVTRQESASKHAANDASAFLYVISGQSSRYFHNSAEAARRDRQILHREGAVFRSQTAVPSVSYQTTREAGYLITTFSLVPQRCAARCGEQAEDGESGKEKGPNRQVPRRHCTNHRREKTTRNQRCDTSANEDGETASPDLVCQRTMRSGRHALAHFAAAILSALSTRIENSNTCASKTATRVD